MTLPLKTVIALAGVACASGAAAQTASEASLNFSGFGTVGLVRTDTDKAQFVVPGVPSGASKSADFGVDSKLGLQANGKLNAIFGATVQVIAKHNGDGNSRPKVEWAFAKAQALPSLAFRVGRMGLPAFAVSDFRDVNYANVWVRPPIDVYGQVPVSHFDGADAIYSLPVSGATLSAQVIGGRSSAPYQHNRVKLDSLVGINLTAELDDGITLRAARMSTELTVLAPQFAPLLGGIRRTPFGSVANEIDPNKKHTTFTGFGAALDRGNWLASAEYTKRKTESYVSSTTGWYGSLGYRVGKFTPYAVYSKLKVDDFNVHNTIPKGVAPALTFLSATVDGLLATQNLAQHTESLGVRWDVHRNLALKAQWDRITPKANGFFYPAQPGFAGTTVNVMAVSADFVF